MPHFNPHLTWVPRNGKKIKIWHDSILGDPPLDLRQDLRRLKDWMESQNLKTLFDISIWGNDRCKSWQGWGVGNIPPDLEGDWSTLKLCLQGKAPLKKKGKDERGWGKNAKPYTTANGYRLTINVPNVPPNPILWKAIWQSKSIPKIDMFIWTLAHNSIQTGENLQRKGWEGPYRCPLCQQAEETSDHLLLNCVYSKEVWRLAIGIQTEINRPQDIKSLLQCWDSLYPFQKQKTKPCLCAVESPPKVYPVGSMAGKKQQNLQGQEKERTHSGSQNSSIFRRKRPLLMSIKIQWEARRNEELWLDQFRIQSQNGSTAKPQAKRIGK
jgi:hypothetical protein